MRAIILILLTICGIRTLNGYPINETSVEDMPIKFTSHNVSIEYGHDLSLNCTVDETLSSTNHTLSWFKNSEILDSDDEILSNNRWSLSKLNSSAKDAGNYTCFVCNGISCGGQTFIVNVISSHQEELNTTKATTTSTTPKSTDVKPVIQKRNEDFYNIEINQTQKLDCSTTNAEHLPLTYTWQCNDEPLPERNNQSSWTITKSENYFGDYKCKVCNGEICSHHTFRVTILRPNYERIKIMAGMSINIVCGRYEILAGNTLVRGFFNESETWSEDPSSLDEYPLHSLNNITVNETGWHTCISINGTDQVYRNFFIEVVALPTVESSTKLPTPFEVESSTKLPAPLEVESSTKLPVPFEEFGNTLLLATISIVGVCILILAFLMICWIKKNTKEKANLKLELQKYGISVISIEKTKPDRSSEEIMGQVQLDIKYTADENSLQESNNLYYFKYGSDKYAIPPDLDWELKDEVKLGKIIGQGEFGVVHEATINGIKVAVKKLKDRPNENSVKNLIMEMEIMKSIGTHENVISMLKCCTQGELFLITEFAANGSLKTFLKECLKGNKFNPRRGSLKENVVLNFSRQIAKGMEYLALKKCVHRDLAARNILVTEDYKMKIADFGLTRNVDDYYRPDENGRLPYKWMAPEAVRHRLNTSKSDVWSFAVVMWEIFTMGGDPYYIEREKILKDGKRLERPENCSHETYHYLMRECWSYDPKDRPTFSDIIQILEGLMDGRITWRDQQHQLESSDDSDTDEETGEELF